MSFLSGGFFGGGTKDIRSQSESTTVAEDMRTTVGGSVGSLVSPGSAVGAGAITAGTKATVTQNVAGLSGTDVQAMLESWQADRASERSSVVGLGSSLAAGMQAQSQQVADILAATKAPDSTTLTKIVPVLIVLAIAWFLTR